MLRYHLHAVLFEPIQNKCPSDFSLGSRERCGKLHLIRTGIAPHSCIACNSLQCNLCLFILYGTAWKKMGISICYLVMKKLVIYNIYTHTHIRIYHRYQFFSQHVRVLIEIYLFIMKKKSGNFVKKLNSEDFVTSNFQRRTVGRIMSVPLTVCH